MTHSFLLLLIWGIVLFFGIFIIARNNQIYYFRAFILDLSASYCRRHIEEDCKSAFDWFYGKWNYEQMLFSFKPLKLEYWFTDEEIREIQR